MKKSLLTLLIFAFIIISSAFLQAQVKNVLLEQFTGAWCGWCVDGSYVMEQIQEKHPDRVIGVKIHNADSMAIPEEAIVRPPLGITGFPMGAVDRRSYSGSVGLSRNSWEGACESFLQLPPKATVQVAYAIHEDIRQVHATVFCTMLETVNDPVKLNLYVVEDSVSGVGTGWDQSNYLSNRAGYEDNPYYNLPAKIVGYQHMKVVRAMCGGPWGTGDIPVPAVEGQTYSYSFTYDLAENWKIKDLHFVGFAQIDSPNNKEILNSAIGVEGTPELRLLSSGDNYGVSPKNVAFDKNLTLENITEETKTYTIKIKSSNRTPDNWQCSATAGENSITASGSEEPSMEVTLEAGNSIEVKLSLTPGETIGVGDTYLIASSNDNPDKFRGESAITCYSAEIENFEIVAGGETQYSIFNYLQGYGYDNLFQISASDYLQFSDQFMNKDHLIWNSGSAYQFNSSEAQEIIKGINSGIKTFVCGNLSASSLNSNSALSIFNVQYNGFNRLGYGSAPWRVWLSGVPADPISYEFGERTEGNLIKYLITMLKLTDHEKTRPFLHMAEMGEVLRPNGNGYDTLYLKPTESIFAVRTIHENTRSVLMALCPFVIVNQNVRQTLIERALQWLDNTGPELDVNLTALDFGTLKPEEDKTLPLVLHNPGDENLVISDIKISGMDSYAFELMNLPDLPLTVAPGEYSNFFVKFAPIIESDFKAELEISSNALLNPEAKLNVIGSSSLTSVYMTQNENTLFSIMPNPATDRAQIVLKSNNLPLDSRISFAIYTSAGTKISELEKSSINAENAYMLDLTNYSAGFYMVVASYNGQKFASPLVIIK
jgi:hypothetical protein